MNTVIFLKLAKRMKFQPKSITCNVETSSLQFIFECPFHDAWTREQMRKAFFEALPNIHGKIEYDFNNEPVTCSVTLTDIDDISINIDNIRWLGDRT